MTLIATWGGSTANCYLDLTAANSFITTAVVDATAWTSATTVQQTAALLEATRDVDSKQYLGARYYSDQLLEFPRAFDGIGWPYSLSLGTADPISIEQQHSQIAVQRATCYQALWLLRNNGRNFHAERIASGIQQYSEAVGPISESATYGKGSISRLCPEAVASVAKYLSGRQVVRG